MKKLSKLARYFLKEEEDVPAPEPTFVDLDSFLQKNYMTTANSKLAGVGGINLGDVRTIVVKNPLGKGLDRKNDKRAGFGLGMGIDAPTAAFAADLIKTYGSPEDVNPETGEDVVVPNWQQVNRAVGNYVRQNIDSRLLPMKLGRVAKNPASRYDGMDTTKIGTILDKKFGRSKIKFKQF